MCKASISGKCSVKIKHMQNLLSIWSKPLAQLINKGRHIDREEKYNLEKKTKTVLSGYYKSLY